jgi:hypothetical protein
MTTFYPEIILNEIISFQQEDFKNSCKTIFRTKDIDDGVEIKTIRNDIARTINYFALLSKQLQDYVTDHVGQTNQEDNALFFAKLKSLKVDIDNICSNNHLDKIITDLKIELLRNGGREEDIVDEESGEVLTYIHSGDGHTYYTDRNHHEYCTEIFFEVATKNIKTLLANYSKSFDANYSLQPKVGATKLSTSTINIITEPLNSDEIILIRHKLFWDEDKTNFDAFFSNPIKTKRITLMNDDVDPVKISEILSQVFIKGNYGGDAKNKKNTPNFDIKGFRIPQGLKWNASANKFAEFFAPLFSFNSDMRSKNSTTLFFDFNRKGVRNPIVKILHSLFYIMDERQTGRIKYSTLETAFKQHNSGDDSAKILR